MKKLVLTFILAVFLSGCIANVRSDVTRFHTLGTNTAQKTFVVVPYDDQEGSLEFKTYAAVVAEKLSAFGYQLADSWENADYAVFFQYGIDNGTTVVSSNPIYGQTGGGTTYTSGSLNSLDGSATYSGTSYTSPSFGVVGTSTSTKTVYRRRFTLNITDIKQSTQDNVVDVFQGKVTSDGSSNTFATVSDCLIDAMFKDFPGESGKTTTVNTLSGECKK